MAGRHRGKFHASVWLDQSDEMRLEDFCAFSGLSRSEVLRALIRSHKLPDHSYTKTLSVLAQLGGLIKHAIISDGGINARYKDLFSLGHEIVKIARELRAETKNADNNRQEG